MTWREPAATPDGSAEELTKLAHTHDIRQAIHICTWLSVAHDEAASIQYETSGVPLSPKRTRRWILAALLFPDFNDIAKRCQPGRELAQNVIAAQAGSLLDRDGARHFSDCLTSLLTHYVPGVVVPQGCGTQRKFCRVGGEKLPPLAS